ncbi:MAG TPA: HEAT repeat domain-containing protein [Gemmataceae bacterium]
MRGREKEYKRRNVQPLLVLAQQTFQLKRPKEVDKNWAWPDEIPAEVLFDPLSTVSATYGVAFQTQFREGRNVWSSRPAIFVIDRDGVLRDSVLRPVDSHHDQDIREEGIFPALDELEEQRMLITALQKEDARREATRTALTPIGVDTKTAVAPLARALKDEAVQVRAGAAAALYWIAPAAGAAVPALREALGDTDRRVRRLSSLALARIGPGARSAVPALIEALKDRDDRVRAATADALKGIGPPARAAVPALTKALKDPAPDVRSRVARALGAIGPEAAAAIPALGRALRDNSEQVRAAAGEALKAIDPEAANKAGIN